MVYLKYVAFLFLVLSIGLYFFGYVPKTTYREHNSKNRSYFNKHTINKVVLIVIDSMQPDMVYSKMEFWPNLKRAINHSWIYPTTANLQPPSMSLAKIKCIITGAIVGFIDVMFNTDSGQIKQDNLIDILIKYRKFVINFYGDITWLKLFPNQFNSSDVTTPFYVRDYYEVDNNVSRNIPKIIQSLRKWDMVIMHYLGIDHIGHTEGPFAPVINTKLREMDNQTGILIDRLLNESDSEKTLIVLTSDHGMSNLGGHGGSSINEITVPLIFFNKKFRRLKEIHPDIISQNDIAPSLAILLGVPIPADNIGVIPLEILSLIDDPFDQTRALLSNYIQLTKIMNSLPQSLDKRFSKINSTIHDIHRNCSSNYITTCIKKLAKEHKSLIVVMNEIKELLKIQFIQHNFILLELGHLFASIACLISISFILIQFGICVSVGGTLFTLSISSICLTFLYIENLNNCHFTAFKLSFSALMLVLTCHTLTGLKKFLKSILPNDTNVVLPDLVIKIFFIINIFGSIISSYIKEENQVCFYLSNTLLFLYLLKELISQLVFNNNINDKLSYKTTYAAAFFILIIDRILRTLNRTGELWSNIRDVGDWLNQKDHSIYLLIALGLLMPLVGVLHWKRNSIFISISFQLLIILNAIHRFAEINEYQKVSDLAVWLYYLYIVFLIGMYIILKKLSIIRYNLKLSEILFFTSFIICRNQNVFLWIAIGFKRLLYRKIWKEEIRHYHLILQYIIFNIIGMTTFFQQGNSYSLTTLDVQPGFVGMTSFIPPIIFPVVAIHTFAGNFYWIFLWLEWLSKESTTTIYEPIENLEMNQKSDVCENDGSIVIIKPDKSEQQINKYKNDSIFTTIFISFILITSLLLLPLYTFCVFHKYQITAWSVYAPKLLYLCFQGGFLLAVYIIVLKIHFW